MTAKQIAKQKAMIKAAKEFASGTPIEIVMKKYGVSYASVYNAIKRYHIDYNYTFGRSTFFDLNYFASINSEDKAYWLGFIFADGSICISDKSCKSYNRLTIGLSVKDEDHLKKFAETIKMPTDKIIHVFPQHSYSGSEMVYLHCNSVKMAADLIKLNCIPRKTIHSEFPPIEGKYIRHFIRGYFDGDGCISGNSWELTSEGNILQQIQKILTQELGFSKTKIRFRKNAYNLRYGGKNQLKKLFHYMYDNATVYLQRKYEKFISIAFNDR